MTPGFEFLLVAALASQAPVVPPASAIARPVLVQSAQRRRPASPGGENGGSPTHERPHQFGIGGSLVASNRGASGGFRYWFGQHVGVNFTAGWYPNRSRSASTTGNNGSTVAVLPSVIFMLTKPNTTRQVDIRPYVGGGVNYIRATRPGTSGTSNAVQRESGMGSQVFGGAEVTFRDIDMMTISGEGVYSVLPTSYVTSSIRDGFNFVFAVHFYLR
jgi:hypothetical protein